MKKHMYIITLFLITSFSPVKQVFAQAHQQGDILLSPGISFGNYNYYGHGLGIPLIFYADFSPHDYASVGPYFGVFLRDGNSAFDFGARGSFHWWQLTDDKVERDLRAEILDLYFSIYVGAEIGNFEKHDHENEPDHFVYTGRARVGAILGLRWYFAEPVALMFEFGGPPMGFTTIGFTFKL